MKTEEYFELIEKKTKEVYSIAAQAREKGLDPMPKVEIPLAMSMAEKVVGLISAVYPQMEDSGITQRILELEKTYGKLDTMVAFKIAEEVAKQKFCKFSTLPEAIEAGIRIGFAYTTLGVVSSPIEGFTRLELKKTHDGKDYFCAYFSGPIRSAGTTASCVALMLIDYLRELFGYAKYDPTGDEVKRYVIENQDYHERVTNLQYMPTQEEIIFLAENIPIQIDGEPTEKFEVSNYKNLPRVATNYIRGGMCLMFSEGLAQKAAKGFRLLNSMKKHGLQSTGFDFLKEYIELHEQRDKGKKEDSPTYINDLVAGRPVFGHPSRPGAFRFRYGRGRSNGFSGISIHPATMEMTDGFIATGTQLKIEKPTKGCIVTSCDSVDGPIVKLFNGSVKRIQDPGEAKRIYNDVEEIIYLGDVLFPFSDVANRNAKLINPGYVEEIWGLELREKIGEAEKEIDIYNVGFEDAIQLSRTLGVSLHPSHIFYWTQISKEQLVGLLAWLRNSKTDKKIILPYNKSEREKYKLGKRALELLGVEHDVVIEHVVIAPEISRALLSNLGIDYNLLEGNDSLKDFINIDKFDEDKTILEIINRVSDFEIRDKAGEFIGARMGRPEKAKLRKLTGSPNVLFPVGKEGGRLRSFQAACEVGNVRGDFPVYFCESETCKKETIYPFCENCGAECKKMFYCPECRETSFNKCEKHERVGVYYNRPIDINYYFEKAREKIGFANSEVPPLVKGVRGTSSEGHAIENLSKGILRAAYDLQVNKDGTIRFDVTEMPLVSFRSKEISVSVEKLREIGYLKDIHGKELVNEEQILELKPHDILLPSSPDSAESKADDIFMRISHFVDDELSRFYGLKPFYNIRNREDLVGHLGVFMAPHNCAGVVCRIIGFSNTLGGFASPYMHAAVRRDCVHPKTRFFYYNEGTKKVFYDEIGDYVERLIKEGAKTKKIDSFGTISVKNKEKILAVGIDPDTHEIKKKKIKYFVKGPNTKEWIRITTATNREYTMTPTHKFMHIKDGDFKFKDANEIKVDDKIPILEHFNLETGIKNIDLISLFKEKLSLKQQKEILVIGNGEERELNGFDMGVEDISSLGLRHKFSKHILPASLTISPEIVRLFGYYAAEGYSRTNKWVSQVGFRICDDKMQDEIISLIRRVFGKMPNLAEKNSKITICSKLVYYLFTCLGCGKGAYEKRVPGFVFGLDKKLAGEYISAFFEGDGSVIKGRNIVFYSVSRSLLDDVALLMSKFRVIARYFKTRERLPGKTVLDRYKALGKDPKKHVLNHLVLGVYDSYILSKELRIINTAKKSKLEILKGCENRYVKYNGRQVLMAARSDYVEDYVKKVEVIKDKKNSYCVEIEWEDKRDRNVLWGEQIINTRCDGDEAAVMLLGDVLLNFSRKFLPSHRGGTQDAPLVLNAKIDAGEVDDQILDFELVPEGHYPLELYKAAEQGKHSSEVKVYDVRRALREGRDPFVNIGFTHDTKNINDGVTCSSYKLLATMQDKVRHQMELVEKIRAADTSDTARLVIERHFIKDMRGNLRKFSMQSFRCVACNEIMRRPPLSGSCPRCRGKVIFTTHEGGIKKYLEPALELAKRYHLSKYIQQTLELTKRQIDSVFGKELETQENLGKWFG
jgi:DNA polymerase II large subunit